MDTKTKRQLRYGKLVRAWGWRTLPLRLQKAEAARIKMGLTRTEFIEKAIDLLLEKWRNQQ